MIIKNFVCVMSATLDCFYILKETFPSGEVRISVFLMRHSTNDLNKKSRI